MSAQRIQSSSWLNKDRKKKIYVGIEGKQTQGECVMLGIYSDV